MSDIYKRLLQIVEYKGFKSLNDFAKNGLDYSSSEKLNRLKKENTTPSFEIMHDISNKFEDINMNWFVTGKGEMLSQNEFEGHLREPSAAYGKDNPSKILEAKNETIAVLKKEIEYLRTDLEDLRTDKNFFRDLIQSKLINNE